MFLLPLGSVPHLISQPGELWRDGLDPRSFTKQPCLLICRRRAAQLVTHIEHVAGVFIGIQGLNLCSEPH